jgi:hypothetical protein
MAKMSYIGVIERYHELQSEIEELLLSIITGITETEIFTDETKLPKVIRSIEQKYPFVDVIYTLDNQGIQTSENINNQGKSLRGKYSKGTNRSLRPYYQMAIKSDHPASISKPYLSNASRNLCISAIVRCTNKQGECAGDYLVVDFDLNEVIEFLMGDSLRARFHPFFKLIYTVISFGLFGVVLLLIWSAFSEIWQLIISVHEPDYVKPFHVIIFLTLALAVFDLGKTILEEEVLMHKDIFRHSSTRRTITRFIAAILIAVSIESLLTMFKAAIGNSHDAIIPAVWMMFAAVGLLVALGMYVYLGAKAESLLKRKD